MADREITIKVKADTSDLEKQVDRGSQRAARKAAKVKVQGTEAGQAAQLQRSAARWEVASASARTAATAGQAYARNRGWVSKAVPFATMMKRAVTLAVAPTVLGVVASVAFSKLLGRGKGSKGGPGGSAGTDPVDTTNQILLRILADSQKQTKSLFGIQVQTEARLDPLGRGLAFQRERLAGLNAGIRPGSVNAALRRAEVDANLAAVTAAGVRRSQDGVANELGLLGTEFKTFRKGVGLQARDAYLKYTGSVLAQGVGGVMSIPAIWGQRQTRGNFMSPGDRRRGIGFQEARGILGPGVDFDESQQAGGGFGAAFRSLFTGNFFSSARASEGGEGLSLESVARGTSGVQGRLRRQLMARQIMGAGNILAPAPTVRAGGESEYAFRVQQQRRGMQGEASQQYLQDIRRILLEMREQGLNVDTQLEANQVRGNVAGTLRGVN